MSSTTEGPLRRLHQLYDRIKRPVAYLSLFLAVVLFYFGDYLGEVRDVLLPAALCVLLGLLLNTLLSVEKSLASRTPTQDFPTITDAVPLLCDAVKLDRDVTIIDVLAATGGTTMTAILPRLLQASGAPHVQIRLRLVDPNSPFARWFPSHWRNEIAVVTERLKSELAGSRCAVDLFYYTNLPCIHGVMLNNTHLVLGFFGWTNYSGGVHLSGAERTHRYYTRGDRDAEYFFDLFSDWCRNCPQKQVFGASNGPANQLSEEIAS